MNWSDIWLYIVVIVVVSWTVIGGLCAVFLLALRWLERKS